VLERRQRRARGKHPAAEQAALFLTRAVFVDLDKGGVLGPILGGAALALPHRDRQGEKIRLLADRHVKARNPRGDLVEPLHDRNRFGGHSGGGAGRPQRDDERRRGQRAKRRAEPHRL